MKENPSDTIAAIATAQGEGGIGIIRLSGPKALEVALKRFSVKGPVEERRLIYGSILGPADERLDVGFLAYMPSPRSYTGEDVIEFHCHGGPLILRQVLSSFVKAGARPAGPGEFTRRAFVNGKLDLSQAEAVIDLIRAQTSLSLFSARGRLEGGLSRKVAALKTPLVELLAHIEAELDFTEEEIDGLPAEAIASKISEAAASVEKLLSTFAEGRALREGLKVLILGRPNAGKSSLMNVLLQEERAIVTPIPGTTRDVIEETLEIRGMPVRLMDTAGLREAADEVEAIGVRLARSRIEEAGLIIFVADLTADLNADIEILSGLPFDKTIIAANKVDIGSARLQEARAKFDGFDVVSISATTEQGIEALKDLLFEKAAGGKTAMETPVGELVASVRHRDCLVKCLEGLERAQAALIEGLPRELAAADIRSSIDALGEITGETTSEDILDIIFSSFCIGK
ncbi:MAG: tRNA uridine-5-carboxymethylaminomethyl(34) synthesis GTPase MnmE [Deltaproteobacteria bacterium GWA2_54_12]|nr:MAG: tRNA uridine-5-carboxymethylaminomethyl(34) synthesis GTPase MnmE [Deltaproteobacteria bacterium GWA2_54_12]